MDLGVELGASTYVFWGGREGAETTRPRIRCEAIKWFRDAIDFLCEYAIDRPLRASLRARSEAERTARRHLFSDHRRVSGVHSDARASRDGRRQPGGRARADGRPELLPRGRAGDGGRQAVSHRPQRSEAWPLRSGSALRHRSRSSRCSSWSSCSRSRATTGRGISTRMPIAPRSQTGVWDFARGCMRTLSHPEGEGAAVPRGRGIQALLAEFQEADGTAPAASYTPAAGAGAHGARPSIARRWPSAAPLRAARSARRRVAARRLTGGHEDPRRPRHRLQSRAQFRDARSSRPRTASPASVTPR